MKPLYIVFFLISAISCSWPAAQSAEVKDRHLGDFSALQLRSLQIGCSKVPVKTISLNSIGPAECQNQIRVKTVSLGYQGGFKQILEYPNSGKKLGSKFNKINLKTLPGTRCFEDLQTQFETSDVSSDCRKKSKIQVTLGYSS